MEYKKLDVQGILIKSSFLEKEKKKMEKLFLKLERMGSILKLLKN